MTEQQYIDAQWVLATGAQQQAQFRFTPRLAQAARRCYNELTGKKATCTQQDAVRRYIHKITELVRQYEQER